MIVRDQKVDDELIRVCRELFPGGLLPGGVKSNSCLCVSAHFSAEIQLGWKRSKNRKKAKSAQSQFPCE